MAAGQSLKQGERILFGIVIAFIIFAVVGYIALETIRLHSDKPMFKSRTSYALSPEGLRGSALFRKAHCTSCHRAMRNGTNMGLSLDGVGSQRSEEWLFNFLTHPEETYEAATVDHGEAPKEAAYVSKMPVEDLRAIAVFVSELKAEQGSASAPEPPAGRSEFIDDMLKNFAPPSWKDKYQDVRDKNANQDQETRQ